MENRTGHPKRHTGADVFLTGMEVFLLLLTVVAIVGLCDCGAVTDGTKPLVLRIIAVAAIVALVGCIAVLVWNLLNLASPEKENDGRATRKSNSQNNPRKGTIMENRTGRPKRKKEARGINGWYVKMVVVVASLAFLTTFSLSGFHVTWETAPLFLRIIVVAVIVALVGCIAIAIWLALTPASPEKEDDSTGSEEKR